MVFKLWFQNTNTLNGKTKSIYIAIFQSFLNKLLYLITETNSILHLYVSKGINALPICTTTTFFFFLFLNAWIKVKCTLTHIRVHISSVRKCFLCVKCLGLHLLINNEFSTITNDLTV